MRVTIDPRLMGRDNEAVAVISELLLLLVLLLVLLQRDSSVAVVTVEEEQEETFWCRRLGWQGSWRDDSTAAADRSFELCQRSRSPDRQRDGARGEISSLEQLIQREAWSLIAFVGEACGSRCWAAASVEGAFVCWSIVGGCGLLVDERSERKRTFPRTVPVLYCLN